MTLARVGVGCGAGGGAWFTGAVGGAGRGGSGSGVRVVRAALASEALSLRASPRADVDESLAPGLRPVCPVSWAEVAPLSETTVNSLGTSEGTGATGPGET
jgi:hypothetical protein